MFFDLPAPKNANCQETLPRIYGYVDKRIHRYTDIWILYDGYMILTLYGHMVLTWTYGYMDIGGPEVVIELKMTYLV